MSDVGRSHQMSKADGPRVGKTGGVVRRMCPDCGVEVEIGRPDLVMNAESTKAQRNRYCKELRHQVAWEILCPSCRGWWNSRIRRILEQPAERAAT